MEIQLPQKLASSAQLQQQAADYLVSEPTDLVRALLVASSEEMEQARELEPYSLENRYLEVPALLRQLGLSSRPGAQSSEARQIYLQKKLQRTKIKTKVTTVTTTLAKAGTVHQLSLR